MKHLIIGLIFATILAGCIKKNDEPANPVGPSDAPGLFICNEGNFQYGNGSLSFYHPASKTIENDVFYRANGYRLGDVVQSMEIYQGTGWIVVNNSHVVFAIDPDTYRERGRITDMTSPRYICFINPRKAYVSQLWDNRIFIIDPSEYKITGHIEVPGMTAGNGSTEQMVSDGQYVYCACWSYQRRVIKIDTATDRVVASIDVGAQPTSLVRAWDGALWVLTDGGYPGSPQGTECARLSRIDPSTMEITYSYQFPEKAHPAELQTTADRRTLYWINKDIWRLDITTADASPSVAVPASDGIYYGLTVSPLSGEIYVADAIDYQQPGIIRRYSPDGQLVDSFNTLITPGAFCWK